MLWTGQKGGKVKHRLIVQLVAHRNASVTSNNAPSGILAIGSGRRVVVKREATINPHTKYFNCEFVGFFFFPLEMNLHLATVIKVCIKAGPWLLVCHDDSAGHEVES